MQLNPIEPPEGIPTHSDEIPSVGIHEAIIVDLVPIQGQDTVTYFVTFQLKEKDSRGKPKFIWVELNEEDMQNMEKELNQE